MIGPENWSSSQSGRVACPRSFEKDGIRPERGQATLPDRELDSFVGHLSIGFSRK
jgi:hypothetical protein